MPLNEWQSTAAIGMSIRAQLSQKQRLEHFGRYSQWVSYISTHLASKSLTALCSGLHSPGYLYSEQPWKIEIVPATRAKGRFTYSLGKYSVSFCPL